MIEPRLRAPAEPPRTSGDVRRGERRRVDEGGRAAQARVVGEGDGEDLGLSGLADDLVLAQALPQGRDEEVPDGS